MEKGSVSITDDAALKEAAIALIVEEPLLMEWRITAHSNWIFPVDAGLGSLTMVAVCVYLWIIFFMEDSSTRDFFKVTTAIAPIQMSFFWWVARKKTVWNYKISTQGGHVEYWEDYFKYSKYVFRGLGVFAVVCILTLISIAPGMIWAIAGVGGMMLLAAAKLMAWEHEIDSECFTWDRPQRICVDRKRNLVVLERSYNPDILNDNHLHVQVFLPKGRIDEFITLCKQYVPGEVEYKEGNIRE
jgi:hypothetical protein